MEQYDPWGTGLPDLLGQIYDAALDAAGWEALTARLSALFGGSAVLFAQDSRSPAAAIFNAAGFDPGFLTSYAARYAGVNVWTSGVAGHPVGGVITGDEIIGRSVFERSEWYNGWLRPQGLYHGTSALLGKDQGVVTQLSVIRPREAEVMPPDLLARMHTLVPHLQRAIRVHQELSLTRAGLTASVAGFERLATAAFIVDAAGRVLFANASPERLMGTGGELTTVSGALTATRPAVQSRLRRAILEAVRLAAGRNGAGGGVVTIPRPEQRPLLALVTPLRGEAAGLPVPAEAALVLVRDPDRPVAMDTGCCGACSG
jgi:hypothetical protein